MGMNTDEKVITQQCLKEKSEEIGFEQLHRAEPKHVSVIVSVVFVALFNEFYIKRLSNSESNSI